MGKDSYTVICENRKAFHDYQILERFETGIVLNGSEVKSVRSGQASLAGAYVAVLGNELWLVNSSISRYRHSSSFSLWNSNFDAAMKHMTESYGNEKRNRKLLCHRKEIDDFRFRTEAKGLTLVPLKIYLKNGRIKLEIALARGKNAVDKRQSLKNRDIERDIKRY